jgi:hypothetical protein
MACPTDLKTQIQNIPDQLKPADKNFQQTMKNTLPGDMGITESLNMKVSPEIPRVPVKENIPRSKTLLHEPIPHEEALATATKVMEIAHNKSLDTGILDPILGSLQGKPLAERLKIIGNDIRISRSVKDILKVNPDIYQRKNQTGLPKGFKPNPKQINSLKILARDIKKLQDSRDGFESATDIESFFTGMMPNKTDQAQMHKILRSHVVENAGKGEVRISGMDGPPGGGGPEFISGGPLDPEGGGGSLTQRETSRFLWMLNKVLRPVSFLESVGRELKDPQLPALGHSALDGSLRKSSFNQKYLHKLKAINNDTPNADPERVFGILNGQFVRNEVKIIKDPITGKDDGRLVTVADDTLRAKLTTDDIKRARRLKDEIFLPAMKESSQYSGFNMKETDSVFTHIMDIHKFLGIQKVPHEIESVLRRRNAPIPKDITPRFFNIPERGHLPTTDSDALAEMAIRSYSSAFYRPTVQQANHLLSDRVNPLSNNLKEYIQDYMGRVLGDKDRLPPLLGAVRFANFAHFIAGSLSFPITNTLQLTHTFAKVGATKFVNGVRGAIKFAKGDADAVRFVEDLHSIPGDTSGKFLDEIREFQRIPKFMQQYERVTDILNYFGNKSERMVRLVTAFAGREEAIEKGLTGRAITDYVNNEVIRKTQFFFTAADRSPLMSNPVVGTLFQFQNYTFNTLEFIIRDLVGDQLAKNKNPMPLLRYVGAMTALAGPQGIPLIGDFFDADTQDAFPSVGKMIGIDLSSKTSLPISLNLRKGILPDISKGFLPIAPSTQKILQIGKYFMYPEGSQEEKDALMELTRSGINILPAVPGGLQLERIRQAVKDVGNDFKKYSQNEKHFLSVTSPGAVAKRSLGFQDQAEALSKSYLDELEDGVFRGNPAKSTNAILKLNMLGIERSTISFTIRRGRQRAGVVEERNRP